MATDLNKIYVLNPRYQLRNDNHRIVLFSKACSNGQALKDWHTFIHPLQAVMLSFFTHNRRLKENLRLLADFFSKDPGQMEKMVLPYVENQERLFTTWKDQDIYFPARILVELTDAGSGYRFPEMAPEEFICGRLDLSSKRLYTGPLLATLMLTNRCITSCRYCYADTSTRVEKMLSTNKIMELIREAHEMKIRQINLIGGEIFLHQDWDKILAELVRLGIPPEFISTKIPFTRQLLEKLLRTGYRNVIQVSLDAADPATLSTILNTGDTYRAAMAEGLRLLDQSGLTYQVSSVLTRYNCNRPTLTGLFRFLSSLQNLRDWRIVPVSNSLNKEPTEFSLLKPGNKEITAIFEYLEEFIIPASSFPIVLSKKEVCDDPEKKNNKGEFCHVPCSALHTHLFILPDGKVTICEQLYWNPRFIIGDVNHNNLKEIWNSPRALYLNKLPRKDVQEKSNCKRCSLFEKCFNGDKRCWSDILKAYGDHCWDFPDPRCSFAPEAKNKPGY